MLYSGDIQICDGIERSNQISNTRMSMTIIIRWYMHINNIGIPMVVTTY